MFTHKDDEPEARSQKREEPEEHDFQRLRGESDARVSGVVVFLVALSIFVVVVAVLGYGVGKVLNARMAKEDGPPSKWTRRRWMYVRWVICPPIPRLQNKMAR
jgi:heme/copper-type cytochrome/quinol oxidase subunit 2